MEKVEELIKKNKTKIEQYHHQLKNGESDPIDVFKLNGEEVKFFVSLLRAVLHPNEKKGVDSLAIITALKGLGIETTLEVLNGALWLSDFETQKIDNKVWKWHISKQSLLFTLTDEQKYFLMKCFEYIF